VAWWSYVGLVIAGIGGGIIGSVAGLASLVSYPALLAVGLPPVTANVSNTVALVFNGAGSVSASRVELVGQWPRMRPLALAISVGSVLGSVALLTAPADTFQLAVPWLIFGASAAILLPTRTEHTQLGRYHQRALVAGTIGIGIYGGYFGAAAGVLMLAMLRSFTVESFARNIGAKNVLMACANGIAAISFVIFAPVRWSAVLPLAVGFFIGGRLGPIIVRRTPHTPLRVVIAVAGIGLAVVLGIQAYT
jgi:hypothetical protein